jgi:hypothetical protein
MRDTTVSPSVSVVAQAVLETDYPVVGSYSVLFVSLAAHAAQFAFLLWFENPRKLYISPLAWLTERHREDIWWRQETSCFPSPVVLGTRFHYI